MARDPRPLVAIGIWRLAHWGGEMGVIVSLPFGGQIRGYCLRGEMTHSAQNAECLFGPIAATSMHLE